MVMIPALPPEPLPQYSELPAEPLFHYTTQQGLLGIIRDKTLWATSISHLNDSREYHFALDLLIKRVKELRASPAGTDESDFLMWIETPAPLRAGIRPFAYTFSMSEKGDWLGLWRGYALGVGGFSIGFFPDRIAALGAANGFHLVQCVYGLAEQNRLIDDLLNRWLTHIGQFCRTEGKVYGMAWQSWLIEFWTEFLIIAGRIKHPAFEEEHEWRLISDASTTSNMAPRYRPTRSQLVPYVTIPFDVSAEVTPIRRVIVGPSTDTYLANVTLNHFLASSLPAMPEVEVSGIPYRIW
jgi:hypothetical protein